MTNSPDIETVYKKSISNRIISINVATSDENVIS